MSRRTGMKLLLFVVMTLAAGGSFAQAPDASPASAPSPDIVRENDRLPFMHTEETEVPETSSAALTLKTLGAMLIIIALIFGVAWGAKKLGFAGGGSTNDDDPELTVISSVSLGSGRTISTLRFGDRILVVGSTTQSFTLLAEENYTDRKPFEGSRSVGELLGSDDDSFENELARATVAREVSKFE